MGKSTSGTSGVTPSLDQENFLPEHEATLAILQDTMEKLQTAFVESEADQEARLNIIHEHEATISILQDNLEKLQAAFTGSETDRAAQLNIIHECEATIATLRNDITQLEQTLAASDVLIEAMKRSRWWKIGKRLQLTPFIENVRQK